MKLNSVNNCIRWVRLHTPIVIKPTRETKKPLIEPFTSWNARNVITKCLGEELYKTLQDERLL